MCYLKLHVNKLVCNLTVILVMADEASDQDVRKTLHIIQSMIDVSAERLEGLRTQCSTSAELTQQEIRTLEGKLIKMFSDQLVTKLKLKNGSDDHIPSLTQWLQVVGLSKGSIQGLCQKISSVEELQEKSEHELKTILNEKGARPEELSRLCRALHNLKRYTDVLKRGDNESPDMHLYWDSWDRHHTLKVGLSPRTGRSRASRASVPSEESLMYNNNNRGGSIIPPSSSVSSINSLNAQCPLGPSPLTPPGHNRGKGMKFPTTPPARRRHNISGIAPQLLPDSYPLTKSKSHESQLAASKNDNGETPNSTNSESSTVGRRGRLPTEPGPDTTAGYTSPVLTSPIKSPPYNNAGTDSDDNSYKSISLQVPKSPHATAIPTGTIKQAVMTHKITHRFTKTFKMMTTCGFCNKPIFLGTGLKCKECKYMCHRDCEVKVAPSCGLPPALLDEFKKKLSMEEVTEPNEVILQTQPLITTMHHDLVNSDQSRDSDRTGSTSTDSDRTPVRVDSQDSQVSDSETVTDGHRWPRQNSLSMREWDIPYEELQIIDKIPIGVGRFGTVYRGYWHGDIAVKVLNVNYLNDEKMLEQFKLEVSTFRKTRHENLILFMGACMKPPTMAIVTSFSKGMTLYTHIHLMKDKFNMNKTTIVAQQISQGMGYLHAKGIVHKDLKTKNIFIENGKVVISDFGFFSISKLCHGYRKPEGLGIPPGWLCYLAPEIMRSLTAHETLDEELPFSNASDVYAFGTVWYELLCGEWPFKEQPPEAVIWQVGKGVKQTLANLQASRDVKDILMLCWSFRPGDRPDFVRLLNILDKLPKKRLARSPSHPIHLSRSAESVF